LDVFEHGLGEGRLVLRPVKVAADVRPAVAELEPAVFRPGFVVALVSGVAVGLDGPVEVSEHIFKALRAAARMPF